MKKFGNAIDCFIITLAFLTLTIIFEGIAVGRVPYYRKPTMDSGPELYIMGTALIELDPVTLRILNTSSFWPLDTLFDHVDNNRIMRNYQRGRGLYQTGTWELGITSTAEKPTLTIYNQKSRFPRSKFTYLFNPATKEMSRQIEQRFPFFRNAPKEDIPYIPKGKTILGVEGDRIRLPKQIRDLEFVSNPSGDYDFLLAITQEIDVYNVWEIPLDGAGNFSGGFELVTTINKFESGSLLNKVSVSYGRILWEEQPNEVFYISIDDLRSDSSDELIMVDFNTGEILQRLASAESEIPLTEPFFTPNGEIADALFWIDPRDIKFLEGKLFIVGSICCRPCETKIKKYISIDGGQTFLDAETPTGPVVDVGTPLFFKVVVTNTGFLRLVDITLEDSDYPLDTCPIPDVLNRGESFECIVGPFEAQTGQQTNISMVEAKPISSICRISLTDEDEANYFGVGPETPINIEKLTACMGADIPPGPSIPVGSPVMWTYIVTNVGNNTLTDIEVSDSEDVTVTCPKDILEAGEFMICRAEGTAHPGEYANTGIVKAKDPNQNTVCDCNSSHYFGSSPGISIEKQTNGNDADNPPGPSIPIGDPVDWTYIVTNTGTVPLTDINVIDSEGVTVTCPKTQLAAGEFMICTASGTALAGQYANIGDVTAKDPYGNDLMDCNPSHYFGSSPGISIKKQTNGNDADNPPGPSIPIGDPVNWTYIVTNTGTVPLTDINVTDNQGVTVTCPKTQLVAGEFMTCTASGISQPGQYANIGDVTAKDPDGNDLMDCDPSHYFGSSPGISIEKQTNGHDADNPPGPSIPIGDPVNWTYIVTNTGDVTLTDINVTDNHGVTVTCPKTQLTAGESMTCTASGTALPGQYANMGDVTAKDPDGNDLIDCDPSHYFGSSPGISIEKRTNGDDADNPPGPSITVGYPVNWTYIVTNTGDVTLTNIVVTDSKGVTVTCPKTQLTAGESMTCTASGTALLGQYANMGDVIAKDPDGNDLIDCDPSHYFGTLPKPCLQLTKTIGGPYRTADNLFLSDKIIPVALEGFDYAFYFRVSIKVSNCGNTNLTGVQVIDTFSNEALPFETDDPGNVTIVPPPDPDAFNKEKLTWTVGTLTVGQERTLTIKVGTAKNPQGKLEPTSAPQTIFYNGQNNDSSKRPTATADGGLSVSVNAVTLTNGVEGTCAGSDGEWNLPPYTWTGCSTITTTLPITQTNTTP